MPLPEKDEVRLRHVPEASEQALEFAEGRTRADLDADAMLRFAMLHAITIVGEAASKLSEPTRTALPHIPWPAIVGMRHRLVHAYFDVDADVLWTSTNESLGEFRKQGRVRGWPARKAYSVFAKIVAGEQRRSRRPARKPGAKIESPVGRYIGKGWLQDQEATWSRTLRRVVFRADGCVLEGEGHVGDGSPYDFQANLLLVAGHYSGSVRCVLRESRYKWESEVDLSVSYASGRELELDGEWIEAADATTSLTFGFSLELLRDGP